MTYKRPQALLSCLRSVSAALKDTKWAFKIVVANNDTQQLDTTDLSSAGEVHVIESGAGKNIARARQLILDQAREIGTKYLVFIDDDEIVTSGWFSSLITHADSSDCAAVAGPVQPLLPVHFRRLGPLFERRSPPSGTAVPAAGGGNLLLRLSAIEDHNFDVDWPLRGGEDSDFTLAITSGGKIISWERDALVLEPVPRSRIALKWLISRSFTNGRVLCFINRRYAKITLGSLLIRCALAILCSLVVIFFRVSPRLARKGLDLGIRNLGFIHEFLSPTPDAQHSESCSGE
ncbi:glycosyltransferase [Leucobacter sp. Z1108]|uniref:glycosyltransferase n=1 Tax=Leucobacter sp. Z1108 TaxID=3439066 RepID=UPI003F4F5EBD